MQKVLIFIDWFTPGYKAGGPTKSIVNLVRHLKDRLELYVLTCDTDYCESAPYPGITSDCWQVRDGIHVCYLQKKTLSCRKVEQMVREADCPVWYLNGMYSRYFSILPLFLARKLHPEKLVIAPRGMLSPQAFRSKGVFKHFFLAFMRCSGLYRKAIFQATSEAEAEHILMQLGKRIHIERVDNLPVKAPVSSQSPHEKNVGTVRLMSAARIAPEKNTLYALERLRDCQEHVIYNLYGQIYNQEYWTRCRAVIAALPENVEVRVHGAVAPEQLYTKILEADFLYLPSCGENFGHAIAEALQLNRPVIISDRTPWRGLETAGVGWDIPLEASGAFAEIIDQCARMTETEWKKLSEKTVEYVWKKLQVQENILKNIKLFQIENEKQF